MKPSKNWARFFLAMSILTAAMIFWFSTQSGPESQAMSDGVTLRVAQVIRPGFDRLPPAEKQSYLQRLGVAVRKDAHFAEFMLLGFNLMGFLRFHRPSASARGCRLRAWGIATLYAATDETHQLFTSGRAGMLLDVLIDSAGSLTGALVMTLALALLARRRTESCPRDGSTRGQS